MQLRDWSLLLLLSAMWGGSFLFMRVAAPVLGAVPLIALRVSIAAVVLCGFGLAARRFSRPAPPWRPLAVVGVLNSALPFALFADALKHIPASLAAPLNATTPLFSAAVAAAWLGEPFTARRALGLILGIAGAALLVGAGPVAVTPLTVRAAASCLVAAGCYGFAAVYTRRHLSGVPSFDTAAYSQFAAAAALLPLVPGTWPRAALTPQVLGAVLALGVVCTALAYLLYFHLIARVGAVRATTVTYLAPAFGVIWGVLLLGETINAATVAGFALILVSAALVNRSAPAPAREPRQAAPAAARRAAGKGTAGEWV